MGVAVKATATVTYGSVKVGCLFSEKIGKLYFDHISIFPSQNNSLGAIFDPKKFPMPPRPQHSDKFTFGQGIFLAGSGNYFGAPLFASLAFLKAGGGYSRLLTPRGCGLVATARAPEVVMHFVEGEHLTASDVQSNLSLLRNCNCAVFGPGVGLHVETENAFIEFLRSYDCNRPLVIDGDGLSFVARLTEDQLFHRLGGNVVLTPHMGELSRLLKLPRAELANDPVRTIVETKNLSKRLCGATIVVKNAPTIVVTDGHSPFFVLSGNSALATAGTGDVLSGVVAALLARSGRSKQHESVATAVWIHGKAGEIAGELRGEDGVTASDVLEAIPAAIKQLRSGEYAGNSIRRV